MAGEVHHEETAGRIYVGGADTSAASASSAIASASAERPSGTGTNGEPQGSDAKVN